jgi:hypothetical protein
MKKTQWLLIVGAILSAVLIAFPLRDAVYKVIIIPVAYLIWILYLLYRVTPQFIWWVLLLLVVVINIGNSIIPENISARKQGVNVKPPQGPVETLSTWIQKARGGVYFKWLIANRLGKLTYQMLVQRETHHVRSVFAPLASPDWTLSKPVQDYLETGLQGSFADFPQASARWAKPAPTPLDQDIADVVKELESKDVRL